MKKKVFKLGPFEAELNWPDKEALRAQYLEEAKFHVATIQDYASKLEQSAGASRKMDEMSARDLDSIRFTLEDAAKYLKQAFEEVDHAPRVKTKGTDQVPLKAGLPEIFPMKPLGGREAVPSLSDEEYNRLCELVDKFSTFHSEDDPEYKEWEVLQKKADKDLA